MIISPIVYAEILVSFLRKAEKKSAVQKLKEFLLDMGIESVEFTEEDFILASDAWNTSLKTKEIQCPSCGAFNTFFCKKCKRQVSWRNHILTDFLIGAHAQNHADVLVTRDRGYYKKYFKVNIME
jgi:predicted nucleic acid-binding protein